MSYFTLFTENEIVKKIKENNWLLLKQRQYKKMIVLCMDDSERQKCVKFFPK